MKGWEKRKRQARPAAAADARVVAREALASVFRGVEAGRFPQLGDRDELGRLLVTVTARKAAWQRRHDHRRKRRDVEPPPDVVLEEVVAREPTPDDAAGGD